MLRWESTYVCDDLTNKMQEILVKQLEYKTINWQAIYLPIGNEASKGTLFSKISLTFQLVKRPFSTPVRMRKYVRMPRLKR